MRIVVDVMGGDHGCGVVIEGVKHALEADASITRLFLVGNETEIRAASQTAGLSDNRVEIVHASEVLTMADKPLEGIRRKKDSSMVRAIELVREDKADAVISPGNTGALVAGSMKLRRLEGVERPAIAARMPSRTRDFVLIDAGANPLCEPSHLAQFAVMGSAYAREILGQKNPRVGVLSNGSEESKGNELTRGAARLCSQLDLNFIGYVEGFHLFEDAVDVVVTDGFTGNVVLKTAESLGYAMMHLLRGALTKTPVRKFGAMLSRGAFYELKQRLDPEVYGGAVLLGLNGIVIKTHGSSRARAVMNAIRVAAEQIRHDINQKLILEIARANQKLAAASETP
ncbi:MAG TPA: phosphate acyltransferase PlsX [Verrucomicrobiae bacterium]|jgi:glycerol-3-phosphate acyltransferase PlsX|nr:phosphate acyltransferase PlsX [Verrucomicrobiae bacterium]